MFSFDSISDVTYPSELRKAGFLGGSRTAIYSLFHAQGFPAFRIGKKIYVSKANLKRWLDEQANEKN